MYKQNIHIEVIEKSGFDVQVVILISTKVKKVRLDIFVVTDKVTKS